MVGKYRGKVPTHTHQSQFSLDLYTAKNEHFLLGFQPLLKELIERRLHQILHRTHPEALILVGLPFGAGDRCGEDKALEIVLAVVLPTAGPGRRA